MKPSVDVIIPVYNPTPIFDSVILNTLDQSYVQIHVIIVDDASNTGKDILDKLSSEENVSVYSHKQNRGGGYARNTGLRYVKSDYVAFCDSDDLWAPKKLDEQIKYMEKKGLSLSHTDIVPIKEDGMARERIRTPDKIDLWNFLMSTQLYCSTVCMHSSILNDARFGTMRKRHPFKFWVKILEKGITSHRVPRANCYTKYTIRAGSVSANRYTTLIYTIVAYLRYPKNKIVAIYCLMMRLFFRKNANSRILGNM